MVYPVTPLIPSQPTTEVDPTTPSQATHVTAEGSQLVTTSGLQTTPIAAGVATDTVIKATPGRIGRILVTTIGTNPLAIYDNASAGSGTIIGQLAASAPIASYDIQMPAANGITVKGNASNPAVTISWA